MNPYLRNPQTHKKLLLLTHIFPIEQANIAHGQYRPPQTSDNIPQAIILTKPTTMPATLIPPLLLLLAYLLGSFPTGYLACKWLKGIDIRTIGSGSTGATNVLRTLGKPAGISVFLIDVLKGAIAIRSAQSLNSSDTIIVLAGLASILGHSLPVWLNFKGGKSVAISLGILLAMDWRVGLSTLSLFLVTILLTKIVSMSSIVGAIGAAIVMYIFHPTLPYMLFVLSGSAYVIWRHRTNIQRIIAGTEPKIGQKLPHPAAK
jgi:acyl phosphate:glycerol-3-phosphate acyltransferase